ncbi:U-scoloptoxin(16)-Er12a-like [Schistocerca nitens]|uniref:U-scoloptoxin(16)-Er12a-like n=1 Tax=Schistocerca nitens TaxID=7011 RepID=UPI0021189AB0|nr:U-scoloptoxin(16)-Er12a-like [Schistocerca nitens]
MKPMYGLLAAALLVAAVCAWEREEEVNENPKYPGKCYDQRRNEGYAVGQTWHRIREPCSQFTCAQGKTKGKYIIKGKGCDPVTPKKGCRIEEGNSKAKYPRCCASLSCPAN